MQQFVGQWYDGRGSSKTDVRLELDDNGLFCVFDQHDNVLLHQMNQQSITVSSRLANSPRYLNFPDGQSVETLDNDAVDQWIRAYRPGMLSGLVHRLESNLSFVALTLLLVVLMVWGTAQYGVPAVSQSIAKALPAELLDQSSKETLMLLEQKLLAPSQLTDERQQALRQHFSEAIASHQDLRIQVDFRSSSLMGPNAFALPNGQIIFTDEIVALAAHDDELLAILGHEIGHVKHKHSLRRLVQNSLYIFILAMMTGDMSGNSELVLTLPVLLAELAYSRGYEEEADHYALEFLNARNIPTHRFSDLMLRLEANQSEKDKTEDKQQITDDNSDGLEWRRYLSTHPMTKDRVESFQ